MNGHRNLRLATWALGLKLTTSGTWAAAAQSSDQPHPPPAGPPSPQQTLNPPPLPPDLAPASGESGQRVGEDAGEVIEKDIVTSPTIGQPPTGAEMNQPPATFMPPNE